MAAPTENVSMALFCDFENVALGVRDANYDKFDIKRVLERLLLKGSIVVKKAYCDWERYKGFKAAMHEANFELIEIPHVRQSGKNSADIRLVVDALDLCYTKSHVNTFVIISGDSDFSPLVSKLRENAKQVIGVGVKQSTSDLLIANCDEFIFYDDLVRESQRTASKRESREAQPTSKRNPAEDRLRKEELEARRTKAIEIAVETFEALLAERGDSGKIWASMLKEAIKRRKPDFSESYFGFRAFGNLLEEAQARGLLEFGRDEKSGAYVYRSANPVADHGTHAEYLEQPEPAAEAEPVVEERKEREAPRTRRTRQERKPSRHREPDSNPAPREEPSAAAAPEPAPVAEPAPAPEPVPAPADVETPPAKSGSRRRGGRQKKADALTENSPPAAAQLDTQPADVKPATAKPTDVRPTDVDTADVGTADVKRADDKRSKARRAKPAAKAAVTPPEAESTADKPARKSGTRSRRPRKSDSTPDDNQA